MGTTSGTAGREGPLSRPGVLGRIAPFGLAAGGTFVVLALSGSAHRWALLLAAALTAAMGLGAVRLPWQRYPPAAQNVLPLAFVAVVLMLRTFGGGNGSGVGALSLLPVCWVAMYAGRIALGLALLGTVAVFYGPALVIGGPDYPLTDAGRGTMPVLVAAMLGISFQRSARALDAQRAMAAASAAQLAAVANVIHTLQAGEDARPVMCHGAREVSGAAVGLLVEPMDGVLVTTGCSGIDMLRQVFPTTDGSALARCFSAGRRVLVPDLSLEPTARTFQELTGARSALCEPVVHGGRVVGVLVVAWQQAPRSLDDAVSGVALMAVEAGIAMERADLIDQLDRAARTDELTGVANRRAFSELLPAELSRSDRSGPLCLAMLDLDHFKSYNDLHGHPAGDRVLRDSARAWGRHLRGTDTLARYGGEEFAIVLPQCSLTDAERMLHKVRGATPHGQTVSIGVAQWDGRETATELLTRVDTALYAAKTAGRDRIKAAA